MSSEYTRYLSSIEDVVEDARNGKMVILVDDEDRENEGDLYIPAQFATPEAVNFMAKHGRGLICLSLSQDRVDELGLSLMSQNNKARHQTAFTVSIEAKDGISTGISAHDRALTIQVAIDPDRSAQDIVTPDHVFPPVDKDGGVLRRAGHTEAAVDIARMAGLNKAGVICEIMNDDGTMARMPDLIKFAQFHNMKIATIADLIAYRRRSEKLVKRNFETTLSSEFGGDFNLVVFNSDVAYAEPLALVKGDISGDEPPLVRMHAYDPRNDLFGEVGGKAKQLEQAMRIIGAEGRGVIVFLRETRELRMSEFLQLQEEGNVQQLRELRDYGIGAQILTDLGISRMVLLTNSPKNVVGLEGYDLEIVGTRPLKEI